MGLTARRASVTALGLAALLAVVYTGLGVASRSRPPVDFDVGPNTGGYLDGFTESEERVPVTFRWTRDRAGITMPLAASGDEVVLKLRLARFLNGTANVRVFVNGSPQGSFSARSGRFRTVELPIRFEETSERASVSFLVEDPAPERLGVAMDWLRFENARWRLLPSATAPFFLIAGTYLLAIALGLPVRRALGIGVVMAIVQSLWFARDPFVMIHVHDQLAAPALAMSALLAFACLLSSTSRYQRLLPLLFLLGYLLKGAALFHPSYWYPDVRLHRRYVEELAAADGSIVERGIRAQIGSNTAYPRRIGGKNYVLPYSPLFYVPFTWIDQDAREREATMKHAGLALAAAEMVLVYVLARALFSGSVALPAAILAIFLPPMMSRLLFAQWPTLFGHVLDVVVICVAAHMLRRPRASTLIAYGIAALGSCLSYISSLFNTTLLTGWLAILERKRRWRLFALGIAVSGATVLLLYMPFTRLFVTEIVPAVFSGEPTAGTAPLGLGDVLRRIYLFYGIGFPAFALAGLYLARRDPIAFRTLSAYGLTFALLSTLRMVSGAFKDLKELVYVGPLVALTAGAFLTALAARGRSGRFAAVALAIGLIGFGLAKFGEYAAMHTRLAGVHD